MNSMTLKKLTIQNSDQLREGLAASKALIYLGSKTSTVMPYDVLEKYISHPDLTLFEGGMWPSKLSLEGENLIVEGAATWKEAQSFAQSKGRAMMTSPTEELACILSGVATSCTGERCFGYGTLRDQVKGIQFMDAHGLIHTLSAEKDLSNHELFKEEAAKDLLKKYQAEYQAYLDYKNAPYPRLEKETDLMVGTEGQLGIVTKGIFSTVASRPRIYLFFALPKWEEDFSQHMKIYEQVQSFRDEIIACELIDANSMNYLDDEDVPQRDRDFIFLEMEEDQLETVYEKLISKLEGIPEEAIFTMAPHKCHELRMKVPRRIFEDNSRKGVVKKGTDVQAIGVDKFTKLLELYKEMGQKGIGYNLFGHFGDAHLHFNYMPVPEQTERCDEILAHFYEKIHEIEASPFAEHGIGLIKQKFIQPFYSETQREMFKYLKSQLDPENKLFPMGFMNLDEKGIE